jgi:hypothetical protein
MLRPWTLVLASIALALAPALSSAQIGGVTVFCMQTKNTSIAGCQPRRSVTDTSLATGVWQVTHIPRHGSLGVGSTMGMFLYSHGVGVGQSAFTSTIPMGTLCIVGLQLSGVGCGASVLPSALPGVCNPGPIQTAMACNAGALGLTVREDVNVPFWYRDPLSPGSSNSNLTHALFYTLR